jgi:hypothetical protein
MHGHTSETVLRIVTAAIVALETAGITGTSSIDNPNWGFGSCPDPTTPGYYVVMCPSDRRGVYVHHMKRFADVARSHPECRWYTDASSVQVVPFEDGDYHSEGELEPESSDEDKEEQRQFVSFSGKNTVPPQEIFGWKCGDITTFSVRIRGENRQVANYISAMQTHVDILNDTGSWGKASVWKDLAEDFFGY